ncbi:ribonuclease domain-containing protein [Chitinibacter sp. ZOR0017]|uniref:ribonuclease domain-containing protein n=1 Tax=Chitinibacter sp. ZOR0017 TaxID=1339254 RepID=UPI00068E8D03|nr:ribonuclease domain-containing protein [Chitinibacter sp. ZOR0017]
MSRLLTLLTIAGLSLSTWASAATPSCSQLAQQFARSHQLNAQELNEVFNSLALTQSLPPKFVSKREAQAAGWQPGRSLWDVLPGKSIGGDRFGNREQRLPSGRYQEADLDYRGQKRNAKRLVYQGNGPRFITIDHYQTFTEVPACQATPR